MISIHSLREEGDCLRLLYTTLTNIFQSTPSARRETIIYIMSDCEVHDFNPLPPRGGRPYSFTCPFLSLNISIHSLREEGDIDEYPGNDVPYSISIHSLREEGDVS